MSQSDVSYQRIFRICWPVAVAQLSNTAMGVIDTIMVGRLGVTALGAVGLGNLLTWWLLSLFFGMLTSVNTTVAQAFGAQDRRGVGIALWQGFYLALLSLAVLTLIRPLVPALLTWTEASAETQAIASEYSRIRLLGSAGLLLLVVANNFYRGLGRTRLPMAFGLAQLALNCGFNYVFIFGKLGFEERGTAGAALGTVVAQLLTGGAVWLSIFMGLRREYPVLRHWRLDPVSFRGLFWLALPVGIQTFMELGGVSVFSAVVARLGDAQLAATNAVLQTWSLAFMLAFSLSVGATTLVGQSVGAGRATSARQAVDRVLRVGYGLMGILAFVYLVWPQELFGLFVSAEEMPALRHFARPLFLVVVACLVFDLRFMVFSGGLRGAGDTTFSMVVNVSSVWLVFVPATLWATPRFGLVGAWACFVVHLAFMSTLLDIRRRSRGWLERAVAPNRAATLGCRRRESPTVDSFSGGHRADSSGR